jgi:hypothetical protein
VGNQRATVPRSRSRLTNYRVSPPTSFQILGWLPQAPLHCADRTQRARSLNKNIEALGGLREVLTQRAYLLMRRMKGLRVHAKLSPSARYGFGELEDALLEIYKK